MRPPGPDPVAIRTRSLEEARSQTVDASAATLRRIERDLHDGTQAQLVALAMRLGQAKEMLEAGGPGSQPDLGEVRRLVEEAHKGAKEAVVELRDLARGIHPPVLDTGLEGALSTLAARTPLPTDVTVSVTDRPTPAISRSPISVSQSSSQTWPSMPVPLKPRSAASSTEVGYAS